MNEQLTLPGIVPPPEATKTQPEKRHLAGKMGGNIVSQVLLNLGIDTMQAPELRPYDLVADINSELGLVAKIQVKTQETFKGPFSFRKGKGLYKAGDFNIAACVLLTTNSAIFSCGVPQKALSYRVEDFQNPDFCSASWDIAINQYLNHLSAGLAA